MPFGDVSSGHGQVGFWFASHAKTIAPRTNFGKTKTKNSAPSQRSRHREALSLARDLNGCRAIPPHGRPRTSTNNRVAQHGGLGENARATSRTEMR